VKLEPAQDVSACESSSQVELTEETRERETIDKEAINHSGIWIGVLSLLAGSMRRQEES
jgi:hypothetical protein